MVKHVGENVQMSSGANLALNAGKVTGAAAPTVDSDLATKAYVDSKVEGLDVKESVKVATTGNITLSGEQTIDNIACNAGDRVLVKNQTNGVENGIYVVATGAWTRAEDYAAGAGVASSFCFVEQGNTNANQGWTCTNDKGNDVVGTDVLVFTQFSETGIIQAGAGLTKTGDTIDVIAKSDGGLQANVDDVQIKIDPEGSVATTVNGLKVAANGIKQGHWNPDGAVDNKGQAITNVGSVDGVDVSAHDHSGAGQGGTVNGANVTNTPAGNIVATDVQAAINELDTEKEALANKDAVNGYAGLNASSRVTKGADIANDDVIIDNAAKGVVLKDSGGTYWRITINPDGTLSTTSLGAKP